MRAVNLGNISSCIIISDVHLSHPNSALTQKFIHTLDNLPECEWVIFLGDIFDFIYVGSNFFIEYWSNVFEAFQNLTRQGKKVAFVEGNHDFGFEHRFLNSKDRSGLSVVGDCTLTAHHPILGPIVMVHGDDVVCKTNYLTFRKIVKSKFLQNMARAIPGRLMNSIFQFWAKASRSQDRYSKLTSAFLKQCLLSYFKKNPAQHYILGHVHVYLHSQINTEWIYIGPSWLQAPNFLYIKADGSIKRIFLETTTPPQFDLE